jgi:gamma-glutamyltranspeptidase/glutathione hydrolase
VQYDYEGFRISVEASKSLRPVFSRGAAAVSSASLQGTELAVSVLRDGGNAFDAAFILAFGLAVYHPQAGNIGGGGYLLGFRKGDKKPFVINYRERAPESSEREHFLKDNGSVDPEATAFGPRSVCVPGTVKAFFLLQRKYGVMSASDLLEMLGKAAEEGCRITGYQAQCLNRLRQKLSQSPESKRIYVKNTGIFREGDIIRNPHLQDTFNVLAREGADAFYRGSIAGRIEDDLLKHGGFLKVCDLQNYELKETEPVCTEIRGSTVWTVPPEGGGPLLLEILNILNRDAFFSVEPFTPEFYHLLAQASKIAFIDRIEYMGDIDLRGNSTYERILNTKYTKSVFRLINTAEDLPTGRYQSLLKGFPASSNTVQPGGGETTHFSIIDREGNAVSNSYTLNLRYGSKWSVDGCGFLLNGSMDAFSFNPGEPNYFNIIGNRQNLFDKNKRPASNMAPVLVTGGEGVEMAAGTPGGPMIPTTLAMIILSHVGAGIDPVTCIEKMRVHHQGWPDVLYIEPCAEVPAEIRALRSKGYKIEQKKEPIGDVHGIFKTDEGYTGVSDYRREGYALSC